MKRPKLLKNIILGGIIVGITGNVTVNSFAEQPNVASKNSSNKIVNSNKIENSIYKEEGEIDLTQYNVVSENDVFSMEPKNKSKKNSKEHKLLKEILKNNEIVKEYKRELKKGNTLSKLGYTTVYVTEDTDVETNTQYLRPLSSSEISTYASGSNSKYKLTLTVTTTKNKSGYLTKVVTKANWSSPGLNSAGKDEPAGYDDWILTTVPSVYYINKTSGSWDYRNGSNTQSSNSYTYIKDSNNNPVGSKWTVKDDPTGPRNLKEATITNTISKYTNHSKKTRHVYAEYVHTWKKVNLTINGSIGVSGSTGWAPVVTLGGSAVWDKDVWNIEAKVSESM